MKSIEEFRQKSKIQLRFDDIDMLGHLNNARFLTFIELARMCYFEEVIKEDIDWTGEGTIVAKATVNYRKPIYLEDNLYIYTKVDHLSNRSFNFCYLFVAENNGKKEIKAEAETIMVCYNYNKNSSIPIPANWRTKITAYEL